MSTIAKVAYERRIHHRRINSTERRNEYRWEPDTEPRRSGDDRRKGNDSWKYC